jgi:hypothetical protein
MRISLAALALASSLVPAMAAPSSEIPQFDLDRSCRGATVPGIGVGRTVEACKRDELQARDAIDKQWTQFALADKSRCRQLATMGGVPTYVEFLTCLEMARDVKKLRDSEASTTGQGR